MTRKRHPRQTIPTFAAALAGARSERLSGLDADERMFPDPLCLNREAEFTDYVVTPRQEAAEALCIECPLFVLCLENARRNKPQVGVWGGIAWVEGRQAHLMDPHDPRLKPDLLEDLIWPVESIAV